MCQCQKGVLQGDPLSMVLFCLDIAPLLAEANQCMHPAAGDFSVPGTIKASADDWHPVVQHTSATSIPNALLCSSNIRHGDGIGKVLLAFSRRWS